jgi:N-acyl-D-amino-acid deacylase
MVGTDGIYFPGGAVHPRLYGSAARLLGPCVRQHRLFPLEDAVYKLSGFAAARFGLEGRGVLHEGCFADLVVFDPDAVADRATYDEPHQYSVGVEQVLVNGVAVVTDGQPVGDLAPPLPGRALRYREAS